MKKKIGPLVLFFLIISCLLLGFRTILAGNGLDVNVVLGGNFILFLIGLASFFMHQRAMKKNNPHAFVRQVTGIFMLKFFVLLSAALCYFYFSTSINKPAIIICAALYLVYSFMGTAQAVKKQDAALKN
jgi:Ca2+/Na+ antiporter